MFTPDTIAGMRVEVSRYACESRVFLRWAKNHRKSRINKKWHKKYGAVYKTCPGKMYNVAGVLLVCPCMLLHLKDAGMQR